AFRIDMLQEHPGGFHLSGTTGGKRGFIRNVRATIDVRIVNKKDGNIGIVIHGHALVAQSLMVAYTILFVMIMVVGLLPGFVETNESSTAADALVFLLFGIFIFYEID